MHVLLVASTAARELVREVDYTLKTLSSSLLGESRTEVPAAEVPAGYENSQSLHQMLLLGESDAWLALGLAFQLAGWYIDSSSLQHAYAQDAANCMLPDADNCWITLLSTLCCM